jgi:hypothetical protein
MAVNYNTLVCLPEQVFAALANGCPVRLSEDAAAAAGPAHLVPTPLNGLASALATRSPSAASPTRQRATPTSGGEPGAPTPVI